MYTSVYNAIHIICCISYLYPMVFNVPYCDSGELPHAPGTLGSYHTLHWARLVHAGVNTAERNHSYHLNTHIIEIPSHHCCTWYGIVMVHNITSVEHQVVSSWHTDQLFQHLNININISSGHEIKIKTSISYRV